MITPIEIISNLVVGAVESVAPDEVRVLLDLDAPHATALNTGTPTPFPRINGYVLIPNEAGATVAYIAWIGIERSPYPKRSGLKDFGLIDLPFPLRKMSVSPVGTLTTRRDSKTGETKFHLSRGVVAFPSVGDQVLLPTPDQVAAIVGVGAIGRRVCIGTSPMSSHAEIVVDPDKLFGRHLAVLGNTGSGKSCTVAGLIRWSLDAASEVIGDSTRRPNARFIVLDPNGEYARAFLDRPESVRLFRVAPITESDRTLIVPAWMWNGHEWAAVTHAQPAVQRPLLLRAIRELKSQNGGKAEPVHLLRDALTVYHALTTSALDTGAFAGDFKPRQDLANSLKLLKVDCDFHIENGPPPETLENLRTLSASVQSILTNGTQGQYFNGCSANSLQQLCIVLGNVLGSLPDLDPTMLVAEDLPVRFDINGLAQHLHRLAVNQGGNAPAYVSTLILRVNAMLADGVLGPMINGTEQITLAQWLDEYAGSDAAKGGQIALVDLSLVQSEVVHVVVAVLARMTFESLQRYRREDIAGRALPTVLVLEEAHNFVRKGANEQDGNVSPAQMCRETFERIAREGRKFGLGLVLSSQRPSELSPTVLAQCNTFLLHRIVNDADQDLVSKLVPDNVAGLLKELPSLPSRQAILLGWAAPLPVLVDIAELPEAHRPQSSDPDFWEVWTLQKDRPIDWNAVAMAWTGQSERSNTNDGDVWPPFNHDDDDDPGPLEEVDNAWYEDV